MPSITLSEWAKLAPTPLVSGVIDLISMSDPFFEVLPFELIQGNAISYNQLTTHGDAQVLPFGGTITAKNPQTYKQVTSKLVTIVGDAEVDGMILISGTQVGDATALAVASKTKAIGEIYKNLLINGPIDGQGFEGLLAAASERITSTAFSFESLDLLLDSVRSKAPDFILAHPAVVRVYKSLLRSLGGTGLSDVMALPSGKSVITYNGVPVFSNSRIPLSPNGSTQIIAGAFDDGSRSVGIAGLGASSGPTVKDVGEKEDKDIRLTRVVWYAGLAVFHDGSLAVLETNVNGVGV